jgi:hypothetical protein
VENFLRARATVAEHDAPSRRDVIAPVIGSSDFAQAARCVECARVHP